MAKTIEKICKAALIGGIALSITGAVYLADKTRDKIVDYIPKIEKAIINSYLKKN